MSRNRNTNPLLLEIMIAVLFLALCSTAIMEVFGFVKNLNTSAEVRSRAVVHIQDIGEQLYVSEDIEELLEAGGFENINGTWQNEFGAYIIKVSIVEEKTAAGWLMNAQIEAFMGDEIIASIPCVHYYSGEVK